MFNIVPMLNVLRVFLKSLKSLTPILKPKFLKLCYLKNVTLNLIGNFFQMDGRFLKIYFNIVLLI